MLAGIGPVPAALLVVAADDPWMPQAAEHLAALDALGVAPRRRRGHAQRPRRPRARRGTGDAPRWPAPAWRGAPVVAVSGRTGAGLDDLRAALAGWLAALPPPDPDADVRLWVDRRFTVRGAGTVVTGTLPAGTVAGRRRASPTATGWCASAGCRRSGRTADAVSGVARVALNLTGDDSTGSRASVLITPDAWHHTEAGRRAPASRARHRRRRSSARPAAARRGRGRRGPAPPARDPRGGIARLTLERALPLRVGDRVLLRDPGDRRLWRVDVLDPDPPRLRRRGAAERRAAQLAGADGTPRPGRRARPPRARAPSTGCAASACPVTSGGHLEAGPWLVSPAPGRGDWRSGWCPSSRSTPAPTRSTPTCR